jgi:hypothetical protein
MTPDELLTRQETLQAGAAALRGGPGLGAHPAPHGRVTAVGSAAPGLMVWRDLDGGVRTLAQFGEWRRAAAVREA